MKFHSDENEPATLKEDDDWSLLKGLGLTLKCAGVLVAPISLFRPEDWRVFLGTGVMLVLLGFLLSLLDEVIYRPESLPPIDAPSLRARWKTGFVILMWCSFMLNVLFDLLAGLIDWLHPGEADSSLGMLALKWGAFVVLGPFYFSTVFLKKWRLARLRVFWRRGFILFLLAGLAPLVLRAAGCWTPCRGVRFSPKIRSPGRLAVHARRPHVQESGATPEGVQGVQCARPRPRDLCHAS